MYMNEIRVFENALFGKVRTVLKGNEPWFVAADVCSAFGVTNSRNVTARVEDDEKGVHNVDTLGGSQNLTVVNEGGLYRMLFTMEPNNARNVPNSEIAKRQEMLRAFKRWITHEVIPDIRRHGMYATEATVERLLEDPDTMIQTLQAYKEEKAKRIALEAKVTKDQPKVLFADSVATSSQSILVGELAKLIKQNGVDIGQNRLFEELRKDGYLCSSPGERWNMPTQRSMDLGLFEIKERTIENPDGTVLLTRTVKCTGRGQIYFINRYLQKVRCEA